MNESAPVWGRELKYQADRADKTIRPGRPPCGADPVVSSCPPGLLDISTSRPHTGADSFNSFFPPFLNYFNSRPHTEGRPIFGCVIECLLCISTHGPTRGPTGRLIEYLVRSFIFQLTAPHGGRLLTAGWFRGMLIFQLTAPHGGRSPGLYGGIN